MAPAYPALLDAYVIAFDKDGDLQSLDESGL